MRWLILRIFYLILFFIAEKSIAQDNPEVFYTRGETFRKSNNFIAALDEYDKALVIDPNNPKYNFARGICYFKLKDYENAIKDMEKSLLGKSDNVAAYVTIAQSYQGMENYDKVIEYLEKACDFEVDPRKVFDYKMGIVEIMFQQEKYQEVINEVENAQKYIPAGGNNGVELLFYEGAACNRLGNYQKAKEVLGVAVQQFYVKDPKVVSKFFYEYGYALNFLGDYKGAQEAFKYATFGQYKVLAAKLSPEYYTNAAQSFLNINNLKTSKEMLKKVLEMKNDISQAHIMLAKIAQREADHSVAIRELKRASEIEEDVKVKAEILKELVQLLIDNSRYDEALTTIDEFLKHQPKNYEMVFMKGCAYYLKNDYKLAALTMEELGNHQGIDIMSQFKHKFLLGLIYRDMKEYNLAEQNFKLAANADFRAVAEMELHNLEERKRKANQ
ncbi:MAG: hypothetical protein OHK0038_05190 [Flammeovirgaceae bacterium]